MIRRLLAVAMLVVMPLATAACSDDDDTATPTSTLPPASTELTDADIEQNLTDAEHLADEIDTDLRDDATAGG